MKKLLCEECENIFSDPITHPNPCDPDMTLNFCPNCHFPEAITLACDVDGCRFPVSCGLKTPDGYRTVCSDHASDVRDA